MNYFLYAIEQHPALVTIIIFILGLLGFLVKHFFFSKDNTNPYIKAGGKISAGGDIIVGNKIKKN